jgi:hypothetical protein
MTFNEVCRRASGRRAYNRQRRLIRARRISIILGLQDHFGEIQGRYLASVLGVHEATISRDLKFIGKLKRDWESMMRPLHPSIRQGMTAQSFRWIKDARGYEIKFHVLNGVRLK